MNTLSLGRYIPYDSLVHRMDPRCKILALVAFIVAIFMPMKNWAMTFTMEGIALVVFSTILISSHMKITQILSNLKSLWIMVIFLLIIFVITPRANPTVGIAFYIGNYAIWWDSFLEAGRVILRLALMIEITTTLTATTKPLDLTYGLEWYLTPFTLIGFPSHILAMTLSLALRFIPTILEDVNRIMRAQASRGVDFEHGKIASKFRAVISLVIPLFVSSFQRSEELANAMECRGYDPKGKRTRYRKLRFHVPDIFKTLFVLAFLALFIYVSVTGFDAYSFFFGLEVK